MRIPVQIGLVLASAAIATQGYAGGPDNPFSSDNAVASDSLDDYRGGFVTDNGLAVSLGIERIVTINGNVAERSQLELGDLGQLTSGRSALSADTGEALVGQHAQDTCLRRDRHIGNLVEE